MSCDKAAHLLENQSCRAPGLLDGCGLQRRWESAFSSLCKCSICRGKKPSINISSSKKTKKNHGNTTFCIRGEMVCVRCMCGYDSFVCCGCVCSLSEYKYYTQASQRVDTHTLSAVACSILCKREPFSAALNTQSFFQN